MRGAQGADHHDTRPGIKSALRLVFAYGTQPPRDILLWQGMKAQALVVRRIPRHARIGGQR